MRIISEPYKVPVRRGQSCQLTTYIPTDEGMKTFKDLAAHVRMSVDGFRNRVRRIGWFHPDLLVPQGEGPWNASYIKRKRDEENVFKVDEEDFGKLADLPDLPRSCNLRKIQKPGLWELGLL